MFHYAYDYSKLNEKFVIESIKSTYWGRNRKSHSIIQSFKNSIICVVCYDDDPVGFIRAVSDKVFLGYIFDLFVSPEYRKRGIGTDLIKKIINHPELISVDSWCLTTSDAHEYYKKLGFVCSNRQLVARRSSIICSEQCSE